MTPPQQENTPCNATKSFTCSHCGKRYDSQLKAIGIEMCLCCACSHIDTILVNDWEWVYVIQGRKYDVLDPQDREGCICIPMRKAGYACGKDVCRWGELRVDPSDFSADVPPSGI